MMSDMEARFGLDERSDRGIRAPGMSGVVLSYKRLLTPVRDAAIVVPYGGLRAMHVVPLTTIAPSDAPTLGGFLGARIGTLQLGVSPEVGIRSLRDGHPQLEPPGDPLRHRPRLELVRVLTVVI